METRLLEFVTQYLQDGDAEEDSGGTGPQQSDDVSLGGQAATASSASGPDGFAGSQRGSAGSQRACLLRVIEPAALCIVPDQSEVSTPWRRLSKHQASWTAFRAGGYGRHAVAKQRKEDRTEHKAALDKAADDIGALGAQRAG
jgi:hypothetical protein